MDGYQPGDVVNGYVWTGTAWVPHYDVGDVVNGHVWTGTAWVPVQQRCAPAGSVLPPAPPPMLPTRTPVIAASSGRTGIIVVVVVLAVICVAVWASNSRSSRSTSSGSSTFSGGGGGPVSVLYEVEGTASSVDITYETASGTSQQSGVSVPLTRTSGGRGIVVTLGSGDFAYISAQNQGESGSVTCRISVGGQTLSENTSRGGYTIAQCDASVP